MNKYYIIKSDDKITWQVMLSQSSDGKEYNDWNMCYCESRKCAEDIIAALNFCETMNDLYDRQEAYRKNEAV